MVLPFVGQMAPMLRSLGMFTAALAVPWQELPGLLGLTPTGSPEEVFGAAMESVKAAITAGDLNKMEEQLLVALDAARRTPGVEDDLQAISLIGIMALTGKIRPEHVRLAAEQFCKLDPRDADKMAPVLLFLVPVIQGYQLTREFGPRVVQVGTVLLKTASAPLRFSLALATARMLLALGEKSEAEEFAAYAKQKASAPDEVQVVAKLEAEIKAARSGT